jgi:hypothetical protein
MSSEGWRLLGHYENFPTVIHNVSRFTHQSTEKKLQKVILRVFHRLNQEKRDLNVLSPFFSSKCEVSFEFGVAEGITFNYLDEEELKQFQKDITKEALPTLDFFCVVRYHALKEGRHVPLKFDYHLLRFVFHGNNVEMQISHERGTRRVSLEDLANFIIGQISEELPQKIVSSPKL